MRSEPTVTVIIPTYNEEEFIGRCLDAVRRQTYPVLETLVVDGGSEDRTRELAAAYDGVRVLDNPRRIQAAGLNIGLGAAKGDIIVRVDGHCEIADDYVERAVEALSDHHAAMVGGAMRPQASGWVATGICAAMTSRVGAGPARFHVGGPPGWVDTVYLGVFPRELALALGGYAEDVGVNEDSEFALRMRTQGGVWFDPAIQSVYRPRSSFRALARQFYRYGASRAKTVRKHPECLAPRQLAAPLLVLGLLSPWRRRVAMAYGVVLIGAGTQLAVRDLVAVPGFMVSVPIMHLSWGVGFLVGIATGRAA